jgi:hypothetical protein
MAAVLPKPRTRSGPSEIVGQMSSCCVVDTIRPCASVARQVSVCRPGRSLSGPPTSSTINGAPVPSMACGASVIGTSVKRARARIDASGAGAIDGPSGANVATTVQAPLTPPVVKLLPLRTPLQPMSDCSA